MLRLRLGPAELARLHLASGTPAVVEMALSVPVLQRAGSSGLQAWRADMRADLGAAARPMLQAVSGRLPEFLFTLTADFEEYLARFDETPRARMAVDLADTVGAGTPSEFQRRLADGSQGARAALRTSITRYHSRFMAGWPALADAVESDLAHRARLLAAGGWSMVFNSLHSRLRWRSPYLELDNGTEDEIDLTGHQLLLVPSIFLWRRPYVMLRVGAPSYLVYPCRGGMPALAPDRQAGLADLLGATRAAVLAVLQVPASTSQLAARARVSLSSASEHASVLRRAGLISTRRDGPAVQHSLTRRGLDILQR